MKNQDILSNGELKRIENLKEFNVPKNLADWRLNLNLDLQEEDKLSMNSKFMNQDLFQWSEFQIDKFMINLGKPEIDSFKMEELRFLVLST